MNKKAIGWFFIIIAILLLFIVPVMAFENTTTFCIDANTSYQKYVITTNDKTDTIIQNITCKFGCDETNGLCKSDPKEMGLDILIIPLVVILIAGLFIYASTAISGKEHFSMQMLLLSIALGLIILAFAINLNIADSANKTGILSMLHGGYLGVIIVFIIVVLYWILTLILRAFEAFKG